VIKLIWTQHATQGVDVVQVFMIPCVQTAFSILQLNVFLLLYFFLMIKLN